MPRKVFTPGEILTAANVNEFLMDQSVMSFSDSTARGSAIPSPIEGMTTYLEDKDTLSLYNATDWTSDRTIQVFADSTARGSAIPSPLDGMASYLQDSDSLNIYSGTNWVGVGASTHQLVSTTSFSAVASHQVDNVFSATYQNYLIIINSTASSADSLLFLRLATGGTADSGSIYDTGRYTVGVAASSSAFNENTVLRTEARIGQSVTDLGVGVEVNIYNPFTSDKTKLTSLSAGRLLSFGGVALTSTTSFDGVEILPDSGTMTGTMSVFGIKEN